MSESFFFSTFLFLVTSSSITAYTVDTVFQGNPQEKISFSFGALSYDGDYAIVSDSSYHCIRRMRLPISSTSEAIVIAGKPGVHGWLDGPGETSLFSKPRGVAADDFGNIYVADKGNYAIRMIDPQGSVSTIAGRNTSIGHEDGNGETASFSTDIEGLLYSQKYCSLFIFDEGFRMIRRIYLNSIYSSCNSTNFVPSPVPSLSPPPLPSSKLSERIWKYSLPIIQVFTGIIIGVFAYHFVHNKYFSDDAIKHNLAVLFGRNLQRENVNQNNGGGSSKGKCKHGDMDNGAVASFIDWDSQPGVVENHFSSHTSPLIRSLLDPFGNENEIIGEMKEKEGPDSRGKAKSGGWICRGSSTVSSSNIDDEIISISTFRTQGESSGMGNTTLDSASVSESDYYRNIDDSSELDNVEFVSPSDLDNWVSSHPHKSLVRHTP